MAEQRLPRQATTNRVSYSGDTTQGSGRRWTIGVIQAPWRTDQANYIPVNGDTPPDWRQALVPESDLQALKGRVEKALESLDVADGYVIALQDEMLASMLRGVRHSLSGEEE